MTFVDTVFNLHMRPVFVDEPDEVHRRLKASHPDSWVKVCIGETGQIVTIPEYLYKDKYESVIGMIKEVLRKQELPMFRRDPKRLDEFIERTARKIIERAQES